MELLHEPGNVIAQRYRILETLGQGGVGTTYEAQDLQDDTVSGGVSEASVYVLRTRFAIGLADRRVALKALSLRGMSDWKMVEMFEREARILSVLEHPAIPRYLDYFQVDTKSDRGFYIVQQLAPGKSLAAMVQSGWRTTEAEVRRIATQILEILVSNEFADWLEKMLEPLCC